MQHLKLFLMTLGLLIVLLFFHVIGMTRHFYLNYWFYDIIAHILGGICIALSIFAISEIFNIKIIKNNLWNLIALTFIAGLAWEAFEVYYDISGYVFGTLAYKLDTAKDLFDDVLGSVIIWLALRNKNK